jgi:putative DNA primase/helicase
MSTTTQGNKGDGGDKARSPAEEALARLRADPEKSLDAILSDTLNDDDSPAGPDDTLAGSVDVPYIDRDLEACPLTESGNAAHLACLSDGRVRWNASACEWLAYDGTRWQPDTCGYLERLAKHAARTLFNQYRDKPERDAAKRFAIAGESRRGIEAVIALLRSEPGISVTAGELDRDPWLLNAINGTIDLRTGKLRPHDRTDLITKICRATYDPAATCPTFERFLAETFDGNAALTGYVQRILGYCLTGTIGVQELYVYHGAGANGKSTLLEAVCHVMADYACPAPPGLLIQKANDEHPTEIADLQGRRLVIASETEEGGKLRETLVKRITGESVLKARRMRTDYFEFPRTFKTILATNSRPKIRESGEAIWRRVRLVPFTVICPTDKRDPDLLQKMIGEADGVLRWLVDGCLSWQRDGIKPPQEVAAAGEDYRDDENPLADFTEERLDFSPGAKLTRKALMAAYQDYVTATAERFPLGPNTVYERIGKLPGVEATRWKDPLTRKTVRGFAGVSLKTQESDMTFE